MYGVGTNVATATFHLHFDDHQVVNVLEILADCLLSEPRVTTANNKIPSGTETDFACNMAWQDELAIIPTHINLIVVNGEDHIEIILLGCLPVFA